MRFFITVGLCFALGAAFAACGGGSTAGTNTSSVATGAAEPPAKAASKPEHSQHSGGKAKMTKAEIAKLPPLTIAKQSGPPPRHIKVIDLRKGTGATVTKQDAVTARYFEVSYPAALKKSRTGLYGPRRFGLDETVKGWTVGLPGMKVGGRRELILPPPLVYPHWRPSWGYAPYVDIYVIDLLGTEPRESTVAE